MACLFYMLQPRSAGVRVLSPAYHGTTRHDTTRLFAASFACPLRHAAPGPQDSRVLANMPLSAA